FEVERQTALLEKGEKVAQATRGWNEAKQETFHQRLKEGSADYRYFPEPDLPKLFLSEIPDFSPETLRASLPELPWERRARYAQTYALKESDAAYLCATPERAAFFDAVVAWFGGDAEPVVRAANYVVSDLAGIYAKKGAETYDTLDPSAFAALINMVSAGKLSSRGAKDVLATLVESGGTPEEIAKKHGLIQVHDSEILRGTVKEVLAEETKAVEEYRAGKAASLQYLIGKSMKATRGAGNPAILKDLIVGELG
ncbi:MAG: Asp-tRNA(Asn)/Glu-tRNA(Gln) amidotransferase GatCAB subunit B, partial [Patescibacteria group bacterium]|nr:Asp-tRNA(Asn)/Glu-tRNA(Gln) amidotransferase GatCAB subunit B [Patescibacteria group bacterium]